MVLKLGASDAIKFAAEVGFDPVPSANWSVYEVLKEILPDLLKSYLTVNPFIVPKSISKRFWVS